ncbi:helix-turn-helix transcriptional regulator [Corynebacteriaceae bacterium 7-707]
MNLGQSISALRREQGTTQGALADEVGISTRGVIRVEQGQTSLTVDVLGRFADALGVRPSRLLALAEEREQQDV